MENNQIVIYQSPDGGMAIDVKLENETIWLRQAQIATLFVMDNSVIFRYLSNI